ACDWGARARRGGAAAVDTTAPTNLASELYPDFNGDIADLSKRFFPIPWSRITRAVAIDMQPVNDYLRPTATRLQWRYALSSGCRPRLSHVYSLDRDVAGLYRRNPNSHV